MPQEVRNLIRMMGRNNPRWGAPRIHGELLKLGIAVTEPTAAKYMVRLPTSAVADQSYGGRSPQQQACAAEFTSCSRPTRMRFLSLAETLTDSPPCEQTRPAS